MEDGYIVSSSDDQATEKRPKSENAKMGIKKSAITVPLIKCARCHPEVKKAEVNIETKQYVDEKHADEAYKKLNETLKEWVLSENLVVLTGAGTSITVDGKGDPVPDSDSNKYAGKTVWGIWKIVKNSVVDVDVIAILKQFDFYDEGSKKEKDSFNLELLLSLIENFLIANKNIPEESIKKLVDDCRKLKDKIIETLKDECRLQLHDTAPHPQFLRTLLAARKRSQSRLKLFTLNYDTLFEQSAEEINATTIDGFSFTRRPVFNGSNFDIDIVRREKSRIFHQENFEEKVFHLYKLHGSLDWEISENQIVRRQDFIKDNDPLIIPPSAHKFEQSYEMPFFEMMSRFQQVLRRENTVLLVVGYSFGDAHVNRVILEALNSNLNFEVVVVSPSVNLPASDKDDVLKQLHQLIDSGNTNITLINDLFQRFVYQMPTISYSESDETKNAEDEYADVRSADDEDTITL